MAPEWSRCLASYSHVAGHLFVSGLYSLLSHTTHLSGPQVPAETNNTQSFYKVKVFVWLQSQITASGFIYFIRKLRIEGWFGEQKSHNCFSGITDAHHQSRSGAVPRFRQIPKRPYPRRASPETTLWPYSVQRGYLDPHTCKGEQGHVFSRGYSGTSRWNMTAIRSIWVRCDGHCCHETVVTWSDEHRVLLK